jgi:hypothetical protein
LCGFARKNHENAKTKTVPRITYSPATLKNASITPGIVCPNNTAIKLENDTTANTVKIYVLQSKIL